MSWLLVGLKTRIGQHLIRVGVVMEPLRRVIPVQQFVPQSWEAANRDIREMAERCRIVTDFNGRKWNGSSPHAVNEVSHVRSMGIKSVGIDLRRQVFQQRGV